METLDNLHQRDKVGVDDFVLLENFEDKDAFLENLRKRYKENIIYVRFVVCVQSFDFKRPILKIADLHWSSADLGQSLQGSKHLQSQLHRELPKCQLLRTCAAHVSAFEKTIFNFTKSLS